MSGDNSSKNLHSGEQGYSGFHNQNIINPYYQQAMQEQRFHNNNEK